MSGLSSAPLIALLQVLCFVFLTCWLAGIFLFLVWAVKYLKADKLKMVALWLVCVGIIGSFVIGLGTAVKAGGRHKALFRMMKESPEMGMPYPGGMMEERILLAPGTDAQ